MPHDEPFPHLPRMKFMQMERSFESVWINSAEIKTKIIDQVIYTTESGCYDKTKYTSTSVLNANRFQYQKRNVNQQL